MFKSAFDWKWDNQIPFEMIKICFIQTFKGD